MKDEIQIIIDDLVLNTKAGMPLLSLLKEWKIDIPTLCYHTQLGPLHRCSLCIVEVRSGGEWEAKHACMLACAPGLKIRTSSSAIHRLRARAAQMLLLRGPFAKPSVEIMLHRVLSAAKEAGIPDASQFLPVEIPEIDLLGQDPAAQMRQQGCILCGQCVAMCEKIGKHFLTFLGRGKKLRIGYVSTDANCGKCRACSRVCPTGYIYSTGQSAFAAKLYR
ncbi:MAG: hypothetical protein H6Q65_921 [Firmicutes bacterium]|nr:hypothetical protein [Bacillota bacterium]